ncbi:MAG: hypothetical protein ACK4VI_10050 [Alphaproteobacteria bacterium]
MGLQMKTGKIVRLITLTGLMAINPTSEIYASACDFTVQERDGVIISEGEPCSVYDAIYVNNHIKPIPYAGLPFPEENLMAPLAVQLFLYREENADNEGRSIDYLISSIPYLRHVVEDKIESYYAYAIYMYAERNGSIDPTGSINNAVTSALNKSGHKSLAELLCFVELDHPDLDLNSIRSSSQYASCLEG